MDQDGDIESTILRLVAERGVGKTICPSEVARDIGGRRCGDWRLLMAPIRRVAVRLAENGQVALLRKGEPVADLGALRGIYRLGVSRPGSPSRGRG